MVRDIQVATEPEMNFGADFFNSTDFVEIAEDLFTEEFLNSSAVWDSPPDSPDGSSVSSEYELESVLSGSEFDQFATVKLEKQMPIETTSSKPTKSALMWNLSNNHANNVTVNNTTNTTTTTTVTATVSSKQQGEQKLMWTPPASPLPLDEFDALDAEITFGFDEELLTGVIGHELFAMDDIQPGNKRKAARLDDSIESKKARARQTRDEITMRTQAALGAIKAETPELKRITHNVLERKRRNDLKLSYQELREHIPELKHVERAPTGQILLKAVEYVEQLKKAEQQLLQSIAQAKAENERLKANLML